MQSADTYHRYFGVLYFSLCIFALTVCFLIFLSVYCFAAAPDPSIFVDVLEPLPTDAPVSRIEREAGTIGCDHCFEAATLRVFVNLVLVRGRMT